MIEKSTDQIEFGEFRLDVKGHQLWQKDESIKLSPKVFETLLILVQRAGELVSKDDLLNEVWKETFVEEGSLTKNISILRKVFQPNEFIKTIPRLGYSFVGEIRELENDSIKEKETAKGQKTLAVLPFKYLSNQTDEDYFGLGLTDALITRLSNLSDVEVRPTSSVLQFAEKSDDFLVVSDMLNVDLLIDGSIQKIGEQVRVTVQLINTKKEKTIWADKIDVTFTDIFSLQDSISKEVVNALTLKLNEKEKVRLNKSFTKDNSAYQNYLRGRYFWNKRNIKSLFKAVDYFKQAIDEDPLFALAYTGLADCYNLLNNQGVLRSHDAFPKAKAAAQKALEIDDELAEAHASYAFVLRSYDWNFLEAEKEFKLAIKYNPNYPSSHQWYSSLLIALERFDEALEELKTAQKLDPLSLAINAYFGFASFYARDFDKSISENLEILEMDKNFLPSHYGLGLAYIEKQMYEEAILEMEKVADIQDENQRWIAHLGSTYAVAGNVEKARKILESLLKRNESEYISPLDIAMIYARLSEKDLAFEWLEKAVEKKEPNLIFLRVDPEFDVLRSDKRFEYLCEKVNLI